MMAAEKLQKSQILAAAIFNDNILEAERQLKNGADPNLLLPAEGIAPLHYAVGMTSQKSLMFTKLLLRYGADPDIRSVDGLTPVHVAATWGRFQALHYLLASGGNPALMDEEGQTALALAQSSDKWDCVQLLEQHQEPAECENEGSIIYTRLRDSQFGNTDPSATANSLLADISNGYDELSRDLDALQITEDADHALSAADQSHDALTAVVGSLMPDYNYREANGKVRASPASKFGDHFISAEQSYTDVVVNTSKSSMMNDCSDYAKTSGCRTNHRVSDSGDNVSSATRDPYDAATSLLADISDDYKDTTVDYYDDSEVSAHGDHQISIDHGCHHRILESDDPHILADSCNNFLLPGLTSFEESSNSRLKGPRENEPSNDSYHPQFVDCIPTDSISERLEGNLAGSRTIPGILKSKDDTRNRRKMRVSFFQNISEDKDTTHDESHRLHHLSASDAGVMDCSRDEVESVLVDDASSCDGSEFTILEGQGLDVTSPDNTIVFQKRASRDKRRTCIFELEDGPYSPADCSVHSGGDTSRTLKEVCSLLRGLTDTTRSSSTAKPSPGGLKVREGSISSSKPSPTISDSSITEYYVAESSPTPIKEPRDNVPSSKKKGRSSIFKHLSPVRDDPPDEEDEVEEYLYYDKEADAHLIEQKLPSANNTMSSIVSRCPSANASLQPESIHAGDESNGYDWKSFISEDGETAETDPILEEVKGLSNREIQARLRGLGEEPGPITETTRRVYLILLTKLIKDPERGRVKEATQNSFKHELAQVLTGIKPIEDLGVLENEMVSQFQTPDPNRKWREGVLKSSFNYLLLDPRVSLNLPMRHTRLSRLEVFRSFISAIFYVGKGKRSRPYQHFYEALKEVKEGKKKKGPGKKVKHIREIWSAGLGVISLHIFQNTIPVEAYTREACMVEALTLQRLTNIKKGDYYGVSSTWDCRKKRLMGIHLLQKACNIFLIEGERMIRPADIKVGQ